MPFKRHNWIPYGSQETIVEIRIKENCGTFSKEIDSFNCTRDSWKDVKNILKQKYGFE